MTPHFRFPNRLRPADTVLYSQMGTVDSGAVSQDMQAALDTSDALAADDFVVPAGGWTVSGFNFGITIGGDVSTPAAPPACGLHVGNWQDLGGVWFYLDTAGVLWRNDPAGVVRHGRGG